MPKIAAEGVEWGIGFDETGTDLIGHVIHGGIVRKIGKVLQTQRTGDEMAHGRLSNGLRRLIVGGPFATVEIVNVPTFSRTVNAQRQGGEFPRGFNGKKQGQSVVQRSGYGRSSERLWCAFSVVLNHLRLDFLRKLDGLIGRTRVKQHDFFGDFSAPHHQ